MQSAYAVARTSTLSTVDTVPANLRGQRHGGHAWCNMPHLASEPLPDKDMPDPRWPAFRPTPFRRAFLGVTRIDPDADYVVAGIPMDIGTTNRAGTRDGPAAIRRASRMLTDGDHPEHWVEPARMSLADIGDFGLALGDIPASLAAIQSQAEAIGHLIALGGEHGITLPLLRALAQRLGHPVALVHFDAHVDTWPDNFGQAYAHGSPFYHAINEGLVDPQRMIQIGIRSPVQKDVMDWTCRAGRDGAVGAGCACVRPGRGRGADQRDRRRWPRLSQLRHRCARPGLRARHRHAGDRRPGVLAGAGHPAAAGKIRFVGMDIVEVSPAYDVAEITALAAATMVWEYLALLGAPAMR